MDRQKLNDENKFSFQKGWAQVPQGKAAEVRSKLMVSLNITTRMAFLDRLKGNVEPKVSEFNSIVNIFNSYGIKDIWGTV